MGTLDSIETKSVIINQHNPPNSNSITIINEINNETSELHSKFPNSLFSVTNRGNGVGIINHNPKLIKLQPIHIIPGRAIIADIVIKEATTRIMALYAPANPQERKSFASQLMDYYTNSFNIAQPNLNNINLIAGDFNCLDINDLSSLITNPNTEDDSDMENIQENNNRTQPDELATIIEAIKSSNNLIDMDPQKLPTFTRTYIHNNESKTIFRRLDRIYINKDLINYSNWHFKNYKIPSTYSDHNFIQSSFNCKIMIETNNKKRWRINNSTILSKTMLQEIDKTLEDLNNQIVILGTPFKFYQLIELIHKIIDMYKCYQKQQDLLKKTRINQLKSLLNTEFNDEAIASLYAINKSKKININNKHDLNSYCEEVSLKYISAKLKKRYNDFNIEAIKDTNGSIHTKREDIENQFLQYYKDLYSKKIDNQNIHNTLLNHWKITINKEWEDLDKDFSNDEIINTIKQLNPNKSPGPDGLTNLFFITHKDKLAPLLASAFNDLLNHNFHIPKSYKEGLIITIPKKGDPQIIKNRRPITLANCLYKIHSKLINNRLLKILPSIINNNQKGFVPGRFIIDNIISTNEVIHHCNNANISGIITLYDFEKAFDSISHDSIIRTLKHIKIPSKLINSISRLLENSTARIEVNGNKTELFAIERGVKQGDPLSPTLFVLVIEVLARSIINDDKIIGLPLNNGTQRLKFQSFADDSQSLVSNYDQLNLVLNHFNNFCLSTSSKINYDKSSSIIIGNVPHNSPPIPVSYNAERYLGYFFNNKGIYRKLPEILKSIRQSLSLWKSAGVTIKTKVNILKSFALSKLTYYSYIEEFNDDEVKEINKIIEWFMSASNNKSYNGFQVINLMRSKRAIYEMKHGGWGLWNIKKRQLAQKLWLFNQFLLGFQKISTDYFSGSSRH